MCCFVIISTLCVFSCPFLVASIKDRRMSGGPGTCCFVFTPALFLIPSPHSDGTCTFSPRLSWSTQLISEFIWPWLIFPFIHYFLYGSVIFPQEEKYALRSCTLQSLNGLLCSCMAIISKRQVYTKCSYFELVNDEPSLFLLWFCTKINVFLLLWQVIRYHLLF